MLSLVKIRIKYIFRKPCLLFWTYILIPVIILIAAIVVINNKSPHTLEKYEKDVLQNYEKDFLNINYDNLKKFQYLNFTSFIVDEEENCKSVEKVLKDNNLPIPKDYDSFYICNTTESNISNLTFNIIKITKEDGKYKANLKCRGGNISEFNHIYYNKTKKNMDDFIIYKTDDLEQDIVTDAFYVYKRNETGDNMTNFD